MSLMMHTNKIIELFYHFHCRKKWVCVFLKEGKKQCWMKRIKTYCWTNLFILIKFQSNLVITISLGPAIFVRYNRVNLCTKMTNLPQKSVRYNQMFVNNRVRYNRVSLYYKTKTSDSNFSINYWSFLVDTLKP